MFVKYNTVLHRFAGHAHLGEAHARLCRGNDYTCTLHAINSCLLKLAKLTPACTVYRGLGGAVPPTSFFEPDDKGICGRRWYKTATTLAEDSAPSAPSSAS